MNTVFSKNKEKRSRSSSNEANNSFVKSVTSRVSGFLPTTITKWFSSPSSSNANGSMPVAEATDSSTEDEAPESPIITQPPSKRIRYSSPGKYNHYAPNDPNCMPTNIDSLEQITPYSNLQSPPGRNTFRRETNYVSTPVRAPNEETVIERNDRDTTMFKSQHSVSNVGPSVATKRKSLFDGPTSREASMRALRTTASNTVVDPKAPCFKPSLFGSPFYPGQTMYGGASMYINQPNIKQRKTALVNESKSSDHTTMSNSARRVMDLLENYSSPLLEAKRISQYIKNSKKESEDNTTISGSPNVNKVLSYKTQELHVPSIATILRLKQRSRLMDTTNAARQIIASHSSTMPGYVQSYQSSGKQTDADTDSSNKFTTKVKTRLTRKNRGETIEMEDTLPPVDLPTAVLQIDKDNLPKFTFGNIPQPNDTNPTPKSISSFSVASSTPAIGSVSGPPTSVKITDSPLSKPETTFLNDCYKFSSPVRIMSELHQISSTPPQFTFNSPERGIEKSKSDKKKDNDSSIVVGTIKVTDKILSAKSKDWQCPDCWVNNKTDIEKCVCCGAKKPGKEPAKSTPFTISNLASNNNQPVKENSSEKGMSNNTLKVMQAASNWSCEDCWVSNDQNVNKCVCCGANNPKQKPEKSKISQSPLAVGIGGSGSDWKCDDCWIQNKSNVDKCAACGAGRPGSKQPKLLTAATMPPMLDVTDSSLKSMVKSQNSNSWECQSCLVKNENSRTKCVCCETSKPGAAKEIGVKSFNFGMATNTTFKFGIDPKVQETNAIKVNEIQPAENILNKKEESETNNNILTKTPSFSFGIPAKKTDDKDTAKDNKTADAGKLVGFAFGIPKDTPVPPLFGSTRKSPDKLPEKPNVEKEKPQEVPKVDFNFSVPKESPKPIFGLPPNSVENKEKTVAVSPPLLNQSVNTEKKEVRATALNVQPVVTKSESTPQKTFTFTGIGITSNLFTPPPATTSSFTNSSQSTPTPTPAVSLFPKPDAVTASPLSMFQKTDAPTTLSSSIPLFHNNGPTTTATQPSITQPSIPAAAPLFSFGSNNTSAAPPSFGSTQTTAPPSFGGNGIQNAQPPSFGGNAQAAPAPATEKPKFNFTFGGSTPLFNNTSFNAPAGGNGMSATNPLAGGNGLGSNKLGSSNELMVNPLNTGNEMGSTPNLFGAATKENLWSSTNNTSNNPFVTNAPTNPLQKPATFTFGSSTPFNTNNTPAFGNNVTPAPNMFGMNQNASSQPSLFTGSVQNQSTPNMFGSPQPVSNPAPAMNIFGAPSVGAAPAFGSSNTIPSFEAPPLNHAPAPAFNFGAPQTTGVFGFGQQPQQQMPQQAGVYSFGGTSGTPQVQFNMGSAPNTTGVRRVRKAIRRNPQR